MEGTFLNIIKAICDPNPQQALFPRMKTERIRNKTRVPSLTSITQYSFGNPNHSNQGRKRNKRNPESKRSKAHCLKMIRCYNRTPYKHHQKTTRNS